jgi:hypothetical protein
MGGIVKDAEVRVGITGTEDIAGAAERALGPWERAGKRVQSALGSLGTAVGGALAGIAQDIARVGTALGAIDLAGSTAKFLSYREQLARTSVVAGASIDALRQRFKQLGDKTTLPDEALARFSGSLRQATYDTGDSSASVKALADEALATGRSLEQLGPLGETLHTALGTGLTDLPDALARIRTAAEELGTSGGPAALQDQIAHLGGVFSQVSIKGKADSDALIATVGELGRGLPARQQAEVQQRVLSRLLANPEGLRHQLGIDVDKFYDAQGKVNDLPGLIEKVRENAIKRWGSRAREIMSQPQNLGSVGTAALWAFDVEAARRAARAPLSTGAAETGAAFRTSEVGEDIARRNKLAQEKRDQAGGLLAKIQSGLSSVLPENPLVQFALLQLAGRLGSAGIGALLAGGGAAGGGAAAPSLAGRALSSTLQGIGGGTTGIGLAAVAASLLTTYGGFKLLGLDDFNAKREQITAETEQQLEAQRRGRVGAIVRAAERAAGTDPTPEGFRRELGTRLVSEIEGVPEAGVPGDRTLQAIAAGLATGTVPASVGREAPDLVAALREALKDSPLEVVVHIEDASGHPNHVVARSKGAPQ